MNDIRSTIKVALIQQRKSADINENRRRLAAEIRSAAAQGAQLIVNQELHDSLYFCQTEDVDTFDLAVDMESEAVKFYSALARECGVVIVTSLFERRAPGLYHNTAVVFDTDGSETGRYRKTHIPDDPGFYEKFYFTPGDLGIKPVDTSLGRLGVLVCWDQWYPEAARLMALQGARMLIYPTAIGWQDNDSEDEKERQREAWRTVQRGHAVANGCYVCAVNRVGTEGESEFWGQSFVADYYGQVIAKAPVSDEAILYADLDLDALEDHRRIWPFFRDRRIDSYGGITERWGR